MNLSIRPHVTLLIAIAWSTAVVHAEETPRNYSTSYKIAVDASGHARMLRAGVGTPEALAAATARTIASWEFEPAQHDGVAAPSEAWLTIHYYVRDAGPGSRFQIVGAEVGPGYTLSPMPEYPKDAVRRRAQGAVHLQVDFDSDGKPVQVSEIRGPRRHDRSLAHAAIAAVRNWRFEPQRVDGVGIAESVTVPFQFVLTETARASGNRRTDSPPAVYPSLPEGRQYASTEHPVVKLLSAVDRIEL